MSIRWTQGTGIRHRVRWLAAIALSVSVMCAAAALAASPVELVETVPIESRLGNPELPSAQSVWLEMIRGSKKTLDFEEFYLSTWPGEPMEAVLHEIGVAAKRGVKVRLLLDARMHATYPKPADSLAHVPGFSVRMLDMGKIAGGVQHSKFFLVDGDQVYLGSQNFDWRSLEHIHELGVRIRDARVAGVFREVFEMDWEAAGTGLDSTAIALRPKPARPVVALEFRIAQSRGDTVNVRPSYSPRRFIPDSTRWDRDAIVRLLDSARREIVVQSLTYSPAERNRTDDALDLALRRAAKRGVHVMLVISDWEAGGPGMISLQNLAREPNIEVKLSTVPEWSGGYIPFARVEHCKYAVADSQRVWVGTSNWEPGYFHGSRNIAVTLDNRRLAVQARRIFEASWNSESAAPVRSDSTYTAKSHGSTAPPGKTKYGE